MILADSNLIIYAASGNYPELIEWFEENQPVASAVSLVEVLGYYKLTAKEKKRTRSSVCRINRTLPNH